MGCDIHVHVEYKKEIYLGATQSNGREREERWFCGDYFILNPYFGIFDGDQKYELAEFYDSRDYTLFATLADVRNYGDTAVIHLPKGLPEDVTEAVKKDADDWGIDGHSHSWFTLRELIDFQRERHPVKYKGFISPEAQKALDEHGVSPNEWCQGTNVPGWEKREWEVEYDILEPLIEKLKTRADELNVIYGWMWETDPRKAYELSDKIRIVFWFDN